MRHLVAFLLNTHIVLQHWIHGLFKETTFTALSIVIKAAEKRMICDIDQCSVNFIPINSVAICTERYMCSSWSRYALPTLNTGKVSNYQIEKN